MSTVSDVAQFLNDFKVKYSVFDILFRDHRKKNTEALLALDIIPLKRKEIIETIEVQDYSEGPLDDTLYGVASMWVFGKKLNGEEIYIKISMGIPDSSVICISFHTAEHKMKYPHKK
ncbi:toxin [Pedobacter psychrophilus]|uniref:toxin n=1 Tax=Pedobacter psychrophilus TaxID=1826909 RepID=UPI0009EE241C|nr:toxin [Pedobacter psychrophilus]